MTIFIAVSAENHPVEAVQTTTDHIFGEREWCSFLPVGSPTPTHKNILAEVVRMERLAHGAHGFGFAVWFLTG